MTDQKRVTQILYSGLGGHGSVAFSLIEADRERDWQHQMLFYGIEPLLPAYHERCQKLGIPHSAVHKRGKNILNHWWQVIRHLKKLMPDVILLHSLTLIWPVSWYCRIHGCQLIAVEHTPNQVKRSSEKKSSLQAMQHADRVVTLTENYRKELKDILGAKFLEEKVAVIPNGIDVDLWSPVDRGQKQQVCRIGMAARFSPSKDFNGLIHAFAGLLKETDLSLQPELHLAGDGATKKDAEALAANLGITDNVHFAGNLNETELLGFMQGLDIYVQASFGETMSTAVMQAMSCGLPVAGSDIPGINNLINGNNGLLYRQDTPGALTKTLIRLVRQPELRQELAGNARTFALENLSASVMLQRYQQLADGLS